MMGHLAGATVAVLLSLLALSSGQELFVEFGDDGSYTVLVNEVEWFRGGSLNIRYGGQVWSSSNTDSYILVASSSQNDTDHGEDSIGVFSRKKFTWTAYQDKNTPTEVTFETAVSVYEEPPVVVFDIVYLKGLTKAAVPDNDKGVLSTFPSFVLEDGKVDRGWMTWGGAMTSSIKSGKWASDTKVYSDLDGGFPLVMFDSAMETAVVLSPLNSFMVTSQTSFTDKKTGETAVTLGPLSTVDTVPEMYKYSTMMVAGGNVTHAMRRFGEVIRTVYKKGKDYREADFSLNYLGYWTDNGACYYYYTGKNFTNYEDVLVAVKEDADKNMIPYRYVQLDSWWYYKGEGGGVKNWTAMPDIFPNGIESMVAKTGWPVVGHNRYWSPDTDYAKKFKFIVDKDGAVPVDPAFWDYLLSDPVNNWRLIVYEQDWLDVELGKVKELMSQVDLGMNWLDDMGMAAQRYGITIEYCMPWTRHILQSVTIPVVTHSRISGDYQPDNTQWIIGDSAILAHAVGLAGFKDNFRTSGNQPDCASKYKHGETAPMLETYVASLSGAPVGPSDMIGTSDVQLIMATCMTDGHLLKTTSPAMSLDSTFLKRALGTKGPDGQLTAAFTEVSRHSWYFVMAADLQEDYVMAITELPPTHNTFPQTYINAVAFQYDVRTGKVMNIQDVTTTSQITLSKCSKTDFKYMVIAPVLPNDMAVLGELNKFITVSETRFVDLDTSADITSVSLFGVPSEKVTVTLYNVTSAASSTVDCVISTDGYATLAMDSTGNSCK